MHGDSQPAPPPRPPARLLIRGVNWLGDAVMTTPALARVREALPASQITLLTHEKLADLWRGHPAIDSVITFGARDGVWSIARRLRGSGFDAALLLPNSPRSALEAVLAWIPRRIGGAWPWRDWLLTDVVPTSPRAVRMEKLTRRQIEDRIAGRAAPPSRPDSAAHQLHHHLRLAATLGGSTEPLAPALHVPEVEVQAVRARFGLAADVRWIGLNAGAEYGPAKRWPVERFIAAGKILGARPGLRSVVFGGRADAELAGAIASAVPNTINLAGRTTLRELCAAMKGCAVVVTNDTGPMHVAAAVGSRVVVPFGSTSPELTGPGLPGDPRHRLLRANVPCSPCFLRECPIDFRCLTGISVEQVVTAVMECLEASHQGIVSR